MQIETTQIFIWIAVMFVFSRIFNVKRYEMVEEEWVLRYRPWFAVVVFAPIILMTVYGPERADVYHYMSNYRNLPDTFREGWILIESSDRRGFLILGLIVKQISNGSETAYRMVLALIHSIPIVFVLRKYSEEYLFSIYVFVAGCYHLAWMMNGQRQFIAVALIFAATPWIVEKKYFRCILVILFASSFHRTALFMIPVIIIVQGVAWNWKTILISVGAIIGTAVFAQDASMFDQFADTVGYSLEAMKNWGDDGMNPIRVAIYAVPLVLTLFSIQKIRWDNNLIINICTNMSVITVGVSLIAVVTSGIMVGRMPVYTSLYNLILLPFVIRESFSFRVRSFIYVSAIILYYLFYLVEAG